MIEKAEDGDGELLGHLMLTARKVAKEQGLEKVATQCPFREISSAEKLGAACFISYDASRDIEWSSTMEWRVASLCTIYTSTSSEVVNLTGPLAKADQFPWETPFCNLLTSYGFILCFCTQGL